MRIRQEYPDDFDILTWVPVSRLRRMVRGYDQAELLAEAVGQELGMVPVRSLCKVRHNRPQSGISGQAGRRAVPDHFDVRRFALCELSFHTSVSEVRRVNGAAALLELSSPEQALHTSTPSGRVFPHFAQYFAIKHLLYQYL